ncbi:MAG TPA: phosphatase PAP2 family protein [Gemmatimonadaceae bacterium]|nr:phosphatase PAP2 family protein [Gemmatimonadaceae bacterium]
MTSRALVAALLVAAAPLSAQPVGTTEPSTAPLFIKDDAWLAAGFVAATLALYPADRFFAERLQNPRNQENRFLRRQAAFFRTTAVPGAFIIGGTMYAVGRAGGNDRLADLGLHGTEAVVGGLLVTSVVKTVLGRARPLVDVEQPYDYKFLRGLKSDRYRSFPSGHTVAGFAAAAAVTKETARWWPSSTWYVAPAMYGGATLVGVSRMYNNKHWASDVAVGAAIGTFFGLKVVRYHHSHADNRIDRWLLSATLVRKGANGYAWRFGAWPDLRPRDPAERARAR